MPMIANNFIDLVNNLVQDFQSPLKVTFYDVSLDHKKIGNLPGMTYTGRSKLNAHFNNIKHK